MMNNTTILVTSAAGRTSAVTVTQLLSQGFSVRALVRRKDHRSQWLENAGADVVVGDQLNFHDLRNAMKGVDRAYHCPPFGPNSLENMMLFAIAAEEAKLDAVALMSGWNPHAMHPSIQTRSHWIANQIYRYMPSVKVTFINPGFFAFPYFMGLSMMEHFGQFMAPFGEGKNAPPSNEDIGRVVASVLSAPEQHEGKCYRPTGPALLSPHDMADIFSEVLNRRVTYTPIPMGMFAKAALAQGVSLYELSQFRYYAEEVAGGTYSTGAPTDHVQQVTGVPAEAFETTAQRYIANPALVHPSLERETVFGATTFLCRMLFTRVPNFTAWEAQQQHPVLTNGRLAHDSEEWRVTAEKQTLNLLG